MSDSALRNLERAVAGGDLGAKVSLVRVHVRSGTLLADAQRHVYGFAQEDIYGWRHPITRTVHAFRPEQHYRSACGTDVRSEHYYGAPNGGWCKLSTRILKGWFPREKITCKRCLKSFRIHPTNLHGGFLWNIKMPDWSVFN